MSKDPSADRLQNIEAEKQAIVIRAIKYSITSGVYFLVKDREIVYVGKSNNIHNRIGNHTSEGLIDFDCYSWIECSRSEMHNLETEYILRFQPRCNKSISRCDRYVSSLALKRKGLGQIAFKRFIARSKHKPHLVGTTVYYDLQDLMADPAFLALLDSEGIATNFEGVL